jgi:plasmid maintenance system antidote protein VapI
MTMNVGQLLKAYMKEREISTRKLAKEMGVEFTGLHRLMAGEKGLNDQSMVRLITWLFSESKNGRAND